MWVRSPSSIQASDSIRTKDSVYDTYYCVAVTVAFQVVEMRYRIYGLTSKPFQGVWSRRHFLFDQPPHEKYHIICRFGVSDWSRTRPLIFARWMLTHGRLVFNWTDFKHYYLQMNMHAQEWSGNQAIIMPFDASSHNHFGFLVLVFGWRGANLALFRWH